MDVAVSRGARIVYASLPTTRHSGGVHVLTQHVELLRASGLDAWLWLPGAPPDWFAAGLPILSGPSTELAEQDLLVLPEVPVVPGRDPAPGARKVIVNQNHFYTFAAAGPDPATDYPGWDPAPDVWTVSEESRDVLRALNPQLEVTVIPNPVDPSRFTPRPTDRPAVTWFARKRPREAAIIHRLLRADVRLDGVDLHGIDELPLSAVADLLGRTTVFIALGHTEGFGLPVLEALCAGALVIGYDGGGGRELFDAPGAFRLPEQRPLLLVEGVVDLLLRCEELDDLRAANRAFAIDRHRPERTLAALTDAVQHALARPSCAVTATHPYAWMDELAPHFWITG